LLGSIVEAELSRFRERGYESIMFSEKVWVAGRSEQAFVCSFELRGTNASGETLLSLLSPFDSSRCLLLVLATGRCPGWLLPSAILDGERECSFGDLDLPKPLPLTAAAGIRTQYSVRAESYDTGVDDCAKEWR
jgi:hypothetical protein